MARRRYFKCWNDQIKLLLFMFLFFNSVDIAGIILYYFIINKKQAAQMDEWEI